ncbi:DUF397 domain-containing protein [Streptomyces sp. NPDC008313]|uniref:DUF397 domain-containing protein n=1 Tax=Streptomyces sp. NPDC008313 TaxID=3364826 RepID=UPI0036F02A52
MADRTVSDLTALKGWRKSSYSNDQGGSCVEVLDGHPSGIPVRDSTVPHGAAVVFPRADWTSFITAIKNDRFPT